jgi:uncharacterized protein (TIGR04222 family)
MSQPWGLSGPQFLDIYGVGIAVAFAVPFLLRLLIRFGSGADAGRPLDPYEVGYLAGGSTRAAQVAIADIVASGAVRVDSSGRVYGVDRAAFDRQSAFLGEAGGAADPFWDLWLPAGVLAHQLQGKIAKRPGLAAIKARLRAEGLLVSSARTAMVWIVSLTLWAALFVAGGLRLAEGARSHRPIGDLQGLLVLSAFACLFSLLINGGRLPNLTTFRGAGRLRRLRSAERHREKEAAQRPGGATVFSPGLAGDGFGSGGAGFGGAGSGGTGFGGTGFGGAGFGGGIESAALLGVALAGFAAVTDESMRSALLAGLPSSSGGSSCGGGGGGCGGGGCGGGGCGG